MPSSLQMCFCIWLEPAHRVVGKRMFVFWGQRYTCARTLVCPLAFWRKESSSPSMSALFHRCLLSKQSRWSNARGTRHKEKKKKRLQPSVLFSSKIHFLSLTFAFPSSIRVFTGALGVIVCLFLDRTPTLCYTNVHVQKAAIHHL